MSDDTNPTETSKGPTLQDRRECLELIAVDGPAVIRDLEVADRDGFLGYVLQCICIELARVSIKHEQETEPALQVAGALVGGLFGIERQDVVASVDAAPEVDEEFEQVLGQLHERGDVMRQWIAQIIGLPNTAEGLETMRGRWDSLTPA